MTVSPSRRRRLCSVRLLTFAATLGGAVLLTATPAAAHVTVTPSTADLGGFTEVTLRVPNERDVATTRVEVVLPEDARLLSVSVRPQPGWTAEVTESRMATPVVSEGDTISQAPSRVIWSGGRIDAGEYQNFDISAGPLPRTPMDLTFKVLQTYADGEVARWIDGPLPSGEEPEHPASVLHVQAPGVPLAAVPAAAGNQTATHTGDITDLVSRVLAGLALAVALGAAGLTLFTRRVSSAHAASSPDGVMRDRASSSV